jgi:hypothetical protein
MLIMTTLTTTASTQIATLTLLLTLLLLQLQVEGLLRRHMREQLSSGSADAVESEVQRFMRLLDADEDESLDIDEVITLIVNIYVHYKTVYCIEL